eukprot:CCRYP_017178-RA/>CCRYP_017178-RA protein AED:0.28 eAED:0.28 QI:163/1/1/1/0/0/2/41/54
MNTSGSLCDETQTDRLKTFSGYCARQALNKGINIWICMMNHFWWKNLRNTPDIG